MNKKDKAMVIMDQLFEMCENDFTITFSGHCGEMVVSFPNEEGYHAHIDDNRPVKDQLQQIIVALDQINQRQGSR